MSADPGTAHPADPGDLTPAPRATSTVPGELRRRLSGVIAPVLAVLVCVGATVLVWRGFVGTRRGQLVEEAARQGSAVARERLTPVTTAALDVVSVPVLAIVVVAAVAIALAQRRWSIAVAAVVLLAGANLTTQVLQDQLLRPDLGATEIPLNSFPSGHATVAASVAATALLIAPVRFRALVAVLGVPVSAGIGLATMVGTQTGAWHRGSDVVGAVLITAAWYFAVGAALAAAPGASVPSEASTGMSVRTAVRVLGVVGGLCAAPGVGALAATAVSMPTDGMTVIAYAGSTLGTAGVVCAVHAYMLRLRLRHTAPLASL